MQKYNYFKINLQTIYNRRYILVNYKKKQLLNKTDSILINFK